MTEKKIAGSSWIWVYSISSEVKPLLWCIKNPDLDIHRIDHQFAIPEGKSRNHHWHKGTAKISRWLGHYSRVGAFMLDPFCGGGSMPAACKMLGRRWLAFEIDPDVAERARERVRMTQPPLPGLVVEQTEMEL